MTARRCKRRWRPISTALVALFPDNSKTGGDTAALPGIWNDKAKFTGIYDKLAAQIDRRGRRHQGRGEHEGELPRGARQLQGLPRRLPSEEELTVSS